MRYYVVQSDAEDEDMVRAEYADRLDAADHGFTGAKVYTDEEMRGDPELAAALSAWQGDPVAFDRMLKLREWRKTLTDPKFQMWVSDRAGELRFSALEAEPYADGDPILELAITAGKALIALYDAIAPNAIAEWGSVSEAQ